MVIDDGVINWIIGGAAVAVPSIGTGIVLLWRKFIAFIAPKVTMAFDEHTALVSEMKKNVPVVSETMKAMAGTLNTLGETQKVQCEDLERHGRLHAVHSEKLDTIIKRLSSREQPTVKDGE